MGMRKLLLIFLLLPLFASAQSPMFKLIAKKQSSVAPFKPTDIADIVLWLPADSITGLSDTDPISTWPDKSGNGNDATMTGSNRPTFQTNELNGKPVVDFVYASAQYFVLNSAIPNNTDLSIFLVYKKASGSTVCPISGTTVDANGYPGIYEWSDNNSYFGFRGNNIGYAATNLNAVYGYITLQSEAGLDSVWRNGVNILVNVVAVATPTTGLQNIGRLGTTAQYSQGQFAEIIIYDRKLTTVERQQVEGYLATKYAL